jgi:hypothetical protein
MTPAPDKAADLAKAVHKLLDARLRLEKHFGEGLFADPARDILLDLFAARAEGRAVSVSDCTIGARVPPTTALRWIGMLEERGLIARRADPRDGRRMHLGLTDRAYASVEAYLREIAPALSAAGRLITEI